MFHQRQRPETNATSPAEAEVERKEHSASLTWGGTDYFYRITKLSLNSAGFTHLSQVEYTRSSEGSDYEYWSDTTDIIVDFDQLIEAINRLRLELRLPLVQVVD